MDASEPIIDVSPVASSSTRLSEEDVKSDYIKNAQGKGSSSKSTESPAHEGFFKRVIMGILAIVAGILLVLIGIPLLILPGPGLLCIVVGIVLIAVGAPNLLGHRRK